MLCKNRKLDSNQGGQGLANCQLTCLTMSLCLGSHFDKTHLKKKCLFFFFFFFYHFSTECLSASFFCCSLSLDLFCRSINTFKKMFPCVLVLFMPMFMHTQSWPTATSCRNTAKLRRLWHDRLKGKRIQMIKEGWGFLIYFFKTYLYRYLNMKQPYLGSKMLFLLTFLPSILYSQFDHP